MTKSSRIMKVAGLSFVGFCAVSLVADKVPFGPETSQIAGFLGAFAGALVGRGRQRPEIVAVASPNGIVEIGSDTPDPDEIAPERGG